MRERIAGCGCGRAGRSASFRAICAVWMVTALLLQLQLAHASPPTAPARIGVVLPLTGSQAQYAARVQSVLDLAAADLAGGTLQTGEMAAPLTLPPGASLQLDYADSGERDTASGALGALFSINQASPLLPSYNASDAEQQSAAPLMAVLGSLSGRGTESLSLGANMMGLPLVSPWMSSAALSDPHSHPSVVRLLPSPDLLAWGLYRILIRSRWFRLSVVALDDDDSKAVADLLLNLLASDGLVQVAHYDDDGAFNGTTVERRYESRFEADRYSIPCSAADVDVFNTTGIVIDRAMADMLASNKLIFVAIGIPYGGAAPDSPAARTMEQVLVRARELGLMDDSDADLKRPNIDMIEQWLGVGWCESNPGIAQRMAADNPRAAHAMTGLQCIGTPIPRTSDVPAGRTNPHALDFQTRLRAHDPVLFPESYQLQSSEVRAYDSVVLLATALRALYTDASYASTPNTGAALRTALFDVVVSPEQHELYSVDGSLLRFSAPDVDAVSGMVRATPESLHPLDMYNWHDSSGSFRAVGVVDAERRVVNVTRSNVVMSDGSNVYTKDRESVYVEGDVLPAASWDSKFIVLAYCIAVLGAWTNVILIEQAISALARHERFKALQWNMLAGLAIAGCSIWPCFMLCLSAMQLDTLTLRFQPGQILGAVFAPIPFFGLMWMLGSRIEVARRVRDGERRVAIFTGGRHGGITSANSGAKHSSRSGAAVSVSGMGTSTNASTSFMTEVQKAAQSLRSDLNSMSEFFNLTSIVAFAALSGVVLATLALILDGVHTDATLSIPLGNWFGAYILFWFGWWTSGMVVFHLHKSALRYIAPFIMAAMLLALFFVLLVPGVEWTYSARFQPHQQGEDALAGSQGVSVYPSGSVEFDNAFALAAAGIAFFVVLVCMALNVNSLRLSKNVLDKLLAKVQSQVDSLTSDLEQEQSAKLRHYDAGRFYRRNVEMINLCRPVFRTYALGLALADPAVPPESLEQALGLTGQGHAHDAAAATASAGTAAKKTVHLAVPSKHSRNSSMDRQQQQGVGKVAAAAARASAKEKERSKSSHLSGVTGRATAGAGAGAGGRRGSGIKEESQQSVSAAAAAAGGGTSKVGAGVLGPISPAAASSGEQHGEKKPSEEKSMTGVGAEPEQSGTHNRSVVQAQTQASPQHASGGAPVKTQRVKARGSSGVTQSGSGPSGSGQSGSSKSAALQLISGSDFALIHCVKNEKSLMLILAELRDFMFTDSTGSNASRDAPSSSISGTLRPPPAGGTAASISAGAFAIGESSAVSSFFSPFSPQAIHARTLADVKLPQLLSNPFTLELVKDVLNKALSPENGAVWLDIQRFRSLESLAARKAFAEEMLQLFIVNGARYEVNLSSSMKESVTARINRGRFTLDLFDDVEREIYKLIHTNNLSDVVGHQQLLTEAAIVLGQQDHKMRHVTTVASQGHSVSATQIVGYASGVAPGAGAGMHATPSLAPRDRERTQDRKLSISLGPASATIPAAGVRGANAMEVSPSLHPRAPAGSSAGAGAGAGAGLAFGEGMSYKYTIPDSSPLLGGGFGFSAPPSRQVSRRASLDEDAAADALVQQLKRADPAPHVPPMVSPSVAAAAAASLARGRSSPLGRHPTISKAEIAAEARRFMLEDEVDRLVNPGREVLSLVNPGLGKHTHSASAGGVTSASGKPPSPAVGGVHPRPKSAASTPRPHVTFHAAGEAAGHSSSSSSHVAAPAASASSSSVAAPIEPTPDSSSPPAKHSGAPAHDDETPSIRIHVDPSSSP